jgi:hypothetical protein
MMTPMPPTELAASQQAQWDLLGEYVASYAEQQPVRKVVVVGNAPLEPDPTRVEEIDSADLVIRINSMAMDDPGAPPCVGTRCHVVVVSRYAPVTPWMFQDYRRRAYLIPQAGYGLRYILHPQPYLWPSDLGTVPIPNAPVITRLLERLDPDHVPNELIPTSGTISCFLAHELFPEADMLAVGFSFLDGRQQEAWRYQSGGSSPVIPTHRLDLEATLLRTWIDDGSMRVLP